jgi:hypothetical protein
VPQSYTVRPGQKVMMTLAHSEVCMHMQVAGKVMLVELIQKDYGDYVGTSAQIYREDGRPFSSPITYGEAGFYHRGDNDAYKRGEGFYFYPPKDVEQPEPLTPTTN